ncbi:zinc-ribbon domain-containing protein [Myxococcus sp. K15C18031901]|uniref:zinc-ribbon domain-containing protein n=1 Tax=Myxococcus dinghuensis TaxID=2906761 RepID=UPI0020A7279C|nr:zinc-ribbon domain-containing protein [Myxococcus dinghuensis]MCP3101704.1 zinc-ribbon domain-containing protein [Myxococcus dinghuensis]
MQIACPQCSMQYDLDPRLLPPSGVPVQCMRCKHVFLASPNGPLPLPAPGSSPPVPGASQGATLPQSSMMRTQLFGGAASTPVPNTTQTFGAVGSGQTPVPNTTQTFGAVGSGQAPVPNATQTFGAVGSGQQAPVSNMTQTFGAVGAGQTPVPNATQTFGAVGVGQQAPESNTTQTFGAVGSGQAPVSNATQTFGAVGSGQAPVSNATQTFGAVGSGQQAPVPNTTQAFGAVPPVAGISEPTPAFGSVLPAQGGSRPASASLSNATQAFGVVPAVAPRPDVTAGRTQSPVFGAASTVNAPTPPSIAPMAAVGQPVGNEAPAPLGRSLTFSAVSSPDSSNPVGSTRLFGAVAAVQDGPDQGPTLTLPPEREAPAVGALSPRGVADAAQPAGGASTPDLVNRKTAPYGVQPSGSTGGGLELPPEAPGDAPAGGGPGLKGGGLSPASGAPLRGPLSLPPELVAASRERRDTGPKTSDGGSRNVLVGVLVGLGILLAGVLAYPAWRDRALDVPPAAVAEKDRASVTLRRDDAASRQQIIQTLRGLVASHPRFVEAQAELVVALSLQLADLDAETESLRVSDERLRREVEVLERTHEPIHWAARVAEKQAELTDIARVRAPARERADQVRKALDAQVAPLLKDPEVEPASARAARVKARALYAAVTAAPDALALAEWLRNVESGPRAWSVVARAEYALSAGSPPDSLLDAAGSLESLRQEDQTLLRAYVLGARLAIRQKEPEVARSLLDDVLALNPNHELARKLLKELDARKPAPAP